MKLVGGTGSANLIVLAVSPILTRLFTPEEFGQLAAFMALAAWLVTISSLRYDQAIVLPEQKSMAIAVSSLAGLLVLTTATLTAIGVTVLLMLIDDPGDSLWLLFLPPMVLITGWNTVLGAYAVRCKEFGLIGKTSVLRGTAIAGMQVGMGLTFPSAVGLVAANVVGAATANIRLIGLFMRDRSTVAVGRSQIREAAKDYSRFPKYTLPASLLSATTLNGLPIAIGIAFGGAVLGVWSLAFRVLSAPLVIIGASISSVYYRRAVELRSSRSESLRLFKKTTLRLGLSSLPVFIVAAVFAPAIFSFSFGPEWAEAGRYFQVMAPWMWVRFSVTPVTMTTLVFDRNGVDFWIQLVLLAYVSICSGWAFIAGPDFLTFLSVLSLGLAAIYFSLILLYGKIASSAHFD